MAYKKIVFCLCLLSLCLNGFAQPALKKKKNDGDSILVNQLLDQSKQYFTDSPAKAMNLASQAKMLSEKIDFPKGVAYALKQIGIVYYYQGKYLEALDHYSQSLKIFKQSDDNVGIANMYNNIGVVYYDQGDDAKALENYLESLKFAELSGDKLRILTALNNVGGVYNIKKATHDKALKYYLMALPICEVMGKKEELGAISVNIGSIYFDKKDDTRALFYFNKSLKAYGNSEGSLNAYNALGKLYNREKNFDEALKIISRL